MRAFQILFPLVFSLCGLASCSPAPEDLWARKALRAKIEQKATIVDVRSQSEYRTGHVAGALNIPHLQIQDRLAELPQNQSAPIIVYCGIGGRAATAKKSLEAAGYTNVWNLGGLPKTW